MIKIICVGRIKESYLKDAIDDYSKRLSRYTKIKIIECNDYDNLDLNSILDKEKQQIEKHIDEKDYVISLDIEGNKISSLELSKKIESISIHHSNIVFIIGGSYGIDKQLKERSNYSLSFSDLTFPHQLFRVILLEQIYRAYKILNNESYHK